MKSCRSSANVVAAAWAWRNGTFGSASALAIDGPAGEELVEMAVVGLEAVDAWRRREATFERRLGKKKRVLDVVVLLELEREALGPASERLAAPDSLALDEGRDRVAVAVERIALGLVDGEVEAEVGLVLHGTQHPASRLEGDWSSIGSGRRQRVEQAAGPRASTAPHPSPRRSPTPAPREDGRPPGRRARRAPRRRPGLPVRG